MHNCCTTVAALISILFKLAANDGVPSSAGRYAVIGCKLKQNANEGCNSCASLAGLVLSFIACFVLLVIAPLVSAACAAVSTSDDVDRGVVTVVRTPYRHSGSRCRRGRTHWTGCGSVSGAHAFASSPQLRQVVS